MLVYKFQTAWRRSNLKSELKFDRQGNISLDWKLFLPLISSQSWNFWKCDTNIGFTKKVLVGTCMFVSMKLYHYRDKNKSGSKISRGVNIVYFRLFKGTLWWLKLQITQNYKHKLQKYEFYEIDSYVKVGLVKNQEGFVIKSRLLSYPLY